MPPADLQADACADSTILLSEATPQASWLAAHSPQLVRALILGALGLGLVGLSAAGAHSHLPTIAATSAASQTSLEADVPAVRHASRSRSPLPAALPHKTAHTPHHVARPMWVRPSFAAIVSPYGMRWGRMHKGIDFGASYGAPIRSVGPGVVIGAGYLGDEGGYGQITIIRHPGGFYSAYAHQSRIAVRPGMHVQAGEIIGYVGSTGHSTGPHLHFEIRMAPHGGQVNPLMWLLNHDVRI